MALRNDSYMLHKILPNKVRILQKNSLWILGKHVHSLHLLYAFVSSLRRVESVCSTHSVSSLKPSFVFVLCTDLLREVNRVFVLN